MNDDNVSLIYTFFKDVVSFTKKEDFYQFCIKKSKQKGLTLDIGNSLIKNLNKNFWVGDICSLDKNNVVEELEKLLIEKNKKINILQLDVKSIKLDDDYKVSQIMDSCIDYIEDGTIFIVTEFHKKNFNNSFGQDAYHLANFFTRMELGYDCIAYCKNHSLSAWIIDNKNKPFFKRDLKNLLNTLDQGNRIWMDNY